MKKINLLRIAALSSLVLLLAACTTPEKSSVDVPVEERDHGPISTYRIVPPAAPSSSTQNDNLESSSAVARLHNQAKRQISAKQYNAAAATLERVLRIAPRNAELWNSLAMVRLQQKRWAMARNMAAKSNSLATANRSLQAKNWRIIANTHQAVGNEAAARKAWQRARSLSGS